MTHIILQPSPFKRAVVHHEAPPGLSLADILRSMPELPVEIWTHGVVRIGRWEIPREHWERVKPRPGSRYMVDVCVRLGQSGQGGKNPLATIASIALIIAATAVSAGVLGPAGALSISSTFFAAGSTSAALLAAGITVVGALALNALAPPPAAIQNAVTDTETKANNLGSASIQANVLAPYEPIGFVAGTFRCSPKHLIVPWSESVNDDQIVYAVVGLDGPHVFEDILVNGTPIEDLEDVEYEVRDVINDDSDLTLITNQVFEQQVGAELAEHKVQDDATATLQDTSVPENSYPTWSSSRSKPSPDEIWLAFAWSALVNQETDGTMGAGGVPIRVRIRRVGDTAWINLPEFHAQRERLDAFRGTLKLRWAEVPTSFVRLDQDNTRPPWGYALYVTNAVTSDGFDVDSYFAPSTGKHATAVTGENGVAVVYLDPAVFPKGTYDVQVMRGYAYRKANFSPNQYKLSTLVPYFFTHTPATSPPTIRQEQARIAATVSWQSMSNVRNQYPLGEKGLSLLAIKAKNLAINALSILVTGYATTYDTSGWTVFEPTRNPAAWWRQVALGAFCVEALYTEQEIDDDALAEWFEFCAANGHECNAFIEGRQVIGDVLRIFVGTARAIPRFADKAGVVIDTDRSADPCMQLFTQRNTRGLSIRRAFPKVPDGFRVLFDDEDNDYTQGEVYVYRRRDGVNIEEVRYIGITSRAKAVERAYLDLMQLTRRAALYGFDADIETLRCVKGTLVALAHDTLSRQYDAARVVSVATAGDDVTGVTVDVPLRISLVRVPAVTGLFAGRFSRMDVTAPHRFELGSESIAADIAARAFFAEPMAVPAGVVIQFKDGSTITAEINETETTDTITFADPFEMPVDEDDVPVLDEGCLVACGPFSSVEKRMIVLGVQPQSDMTASLTLVDEAPPVLLFAADGAALFFGADRATSPL